MPKLEPKLATIDPIAPNPTIPKVFPKISSPANRFFSFSNKRFISAKSLTPIKALAYSIPPIISLDPINKLATINSLTAFAFAPGVLNTTIPLSVYSSTGILFTPAPALAKATRDDGIG